MPDAPGSVELSVLVPCFNEEGNLPELVERTERVFERRRIAGEIVLVNDGSRDGTGALIDELARRHARVVAVHHPTNRGIPAGWKSGFEASHGRYVCTIDADLQYQPEAIAVLHREMVFSRADLVQGWRSTLERREYDHRYYMSRGLDHLLKLAFGMHEHDVKSGFVVYKREVFEDILQDAGRYYYFQHMITVLAKAKGYSLRQVETVFEERQAGESFITRLPLKMMGRTLVDVVRGVVELRLRKPKDQSLAVALSGRAPKPGERSRAGWRRPRGVGTPHAPSYLADLERTQWLPSAELRDLRLRRLRRLLQHAYEHVGYWRELFQVSGITPDDVRSLDDLRSVPILTKQALRDNLYFDLLSDDSDKRCIRKVTTSGASGEPVSVFVDPLQLDLRWATRMRGLGWTGVASGSRRVQLLWPGAMSRPEEGRHPVAPDEGQLQTGAIDDAEAERLVALVGRRGGALLEGDVEALHLLADALARRGRVASGVKAVLTAGQTLAPAVRALIERQLGAPVFDRYATRELGLVAQECEAHAGLHVNAESYLVEVVRDGRPAAEGEPGEVLVTDLNNRCVPLLRYRTGDVAVAMAGACSCGRGLPLLRRVAGREEVFLHGTDRRVVPGALLADLFAAYEYAVVRYQAVQETADLVRVRVVRKSRFTADTQAAIHATLVRLLGPGVHVRLEPVDALPEGTEAEPPCVTRLSLPDRTPAAKPRADGSHGGRAGAV